MIFLWILLSRREKFFAVNKEKRDFCTSWWLVFITIVCIHLYDIIVPDNLAAEHRYKVAFLREIAIAIPCITASLHLLKRKEIKEIKFRKIDKRLIPVICVLPIISQQFINSAIAPINTLMEFLFGLGESGTAVPSGFSETVFAVMAVCVAAPILEEILCRGFIMHYLKEYGVVINLIVSAAVFSMLHFSPDTFFVIFFMGILLGVIRLATNSLWASIIAHAANNAVAFAASFIGFIPQQAALVITIVSVAAFPAAIWLLLKFSPAENREYIQYEAKKKPGLSLGMILSVSAYAFYMIIIIFAKISAYLSNIVYMI